MLPVELSVEGPFPGDSATTKHGMPEGGFYGACIKAMNNESENFQLTSVTGLTSVATTVWFRSGVPPETRRIARTKGPKTPLKPLSTLLYDVDATISAEPTEKFPRSERYRLAFKIVECGLFLSGTSWLADLKNRSKSIKRSRPDVEQTRRFLLDTHASKEDFKDDDFHQFAEHAFAIGVLLTEIGTGRLVHEIPQISKATGQGFSLYAPQTDPPSRPVLFDGAQINNILVVSMGDGYARSVKVCLESKQSWRRAAKHTAAVRAEVYQNVLADYYTDVYLP